MNHRDNPLFWSLSAGHWFATDVRISWLLLLVCGAFMISLGAIYGLAAFAVLFISVLLHEFGHITAARATGGQGDEILMWPLGGLAFVQPSRNLASQIWTSAAGPIVNFCLCLMAFTVIWYAPDYVQNVWYPFLLPIPREDFGKNPLQDIAAITFSLNWLLLLVNLVPAYPLDGGQIVRTMLAAQRGSTAGAEVSCWVGIISAVLLGLVGVLVRDASWLLGLAVFIFMFAMFDLQRLQMADLSDESEFGYDFSQGYTSLERSIPTAQEPRPGLWTRWKEQREADRRKKEMAQEMEAESQLDSILAKLHEHGMTALSPVEKRILERASAKYRKGKQES